jgi:hypothetical protein
VFVTLTAPSFGHVHTRAVGKDGRALHCRARRDQADKTCAHGRPVTCTRRHRPDDPALGTPLCPRCFDYGGAVAWNHHASELWRRTTIRVYRELGHLLRRSEATVKRQVRLSYVKVAEWQRRGLIHFHAAIRLDARPEGPDDPEHAPPSDGYTLDVLDAAIRAAVAYASVPYSSALSCERARSTDHSRAFHSTIATSNPPRSHLSGPSMDTATCTDSRNHKTNGIATSTSSHMADLIDATTGHPHACSATPDDDHSTWRGGGRGGQGLASDEGGCAAGTLDGTDRHIGSDREPRQRFAPRRPANSERLFGDLALPHVDPRPRTAVARWGDQIDIRPIEPTHLVAIEDQLRATDRDAPKGLSRGQIAGYLAKYATKDTEVLAQLRPNLDIYALATLRMPPHVRRLAVCAWLQARAWHVRDERHLRARRWVHQFGYGGHYLTKSRRYSTTFGKLRQARRDWHLTRQRAARARDAERRITSLAHREPIEHVSTDDHTDSHADPDQFVLAVQWRLDGIGWRTVGDALLAQTARRQALNARDEARAQRAAERELEPWID